MAADARPLGTGPSLPFVLLGVGAGKRVRLMQAARQDLGLPPAIVVEWRDWLVRATLLEAALARPCVFKIEAPGDDPSLHYLLLQEGCQLLGRVPTCGCSMRHTNCCS